MWGQFDKMAGGLCQGAPTIAKLFVEEFISRHRVPFQLLLDMGPSFLSNPTKCA